MDARDLVELAAVVATHGQALVSRSPRLSENGMQSYWTASKCRLERWTIALRLFQETQVSGQQSAAVAWEAFEPTIEEILTGEVLTRVWTAVATAHDRRYGRDESEPIARSILTGHLEARNRVLRLLLQSPPSVAARLETLNMLRRRCERWTDVLVGHLLPLGDLADLAFDPQRAQDFAEGFKRQYLAGVGDTAWDMTIGSLTAAFRGAGGCDSPNCDLNAGIASSVLACFPSGLFDSTGLLRSLWLTRMQQTTIDAEGLVEELIALDISVLPTSPRRGE